MREPDHAAAELHDQAVRAIFAVGLHLQGTAEIAEDPLVRRRIEGALSDLDDLVRVIRDTVFHLDRPLDDRVPHQAIAHLCVYPPSRTPPQPGR